VDGGRHVASARRQIQHATLNFGAHVFGRAVGQHVLGIDGAPESQLTSELGFQALGIHSLCAHLDRVENLHARVDEIGQQLEDCPAGVKEDAGWRVGLDELEKLLEPLEPTTALPPAITYSDTATRTFEEAWWNDIYTLAHGKYINKDNADVVQDQETLRMTVHRHRDLQKLGDYLINKHLEAITAAGMDGRDGNREIYAKRSTDDGGTWLADTRLTITSDISEDLALPYRGGTFTSFGWIIRTAISKSTIQPSLSQLTMFVCPGRGIRLCVL
jgi:hypothetical protein